MKFTELQPPAGGSAPVPYVNPDAAADWSYLHNRKLGRIAYLFGHPSVGVAATIDLFASEVRKLGLAAGDGIALDLEVNDGRGPGAVHWPGAPLTAGCSTPTRPTMPSCSSPLTPARPGNDLYRSEVPIPAQAAAQAWSGIFRMWFPPRPA